MVGYLRGVPLPVSTLWAGDSLENRPTFTLARDPVLGPSIQDIEGSTLVICE